MLILLVLTLSSIAEEPVKITGLSGDDKKLARFIAGIEFLEAERTLSPAEKSEWYKKLCELTGLSTEKAEIIVDRFKNNPEKWAKVLEYASQEVKKKEPKKEDTKTDIKKENIKVKEEKNEQ